MFRERAAWAIMGECRSRPTGRSGIPARRPSRSAPGAARTGSAPRFVVQRHAARRLHYDFRLERNGALASWAVPKGVPLEQGERHLAVHVEDHPLDYADFEGEIPAGQYGAGTVEIWDRGTYELVEEKKDGGLTVRLHGARLDGTWTLVPAHLDGDPKNWLLLRKDGKDSAAGRARLRAHARDVDRHAPGRRRLGVRAEVGRLSRSRLRQRRRRHAAQPERERPHRPLRGRRPSPRQAVRSPSAVLDGEICALDESGRSGFGLLQQGPARSSTWRSTSSSATASRCSTDYLERREALEQLLDASVDGVLVSPSFDDGAALEQVAREHASRASSRSGPTRPTGPAVDRWSGAS